MWVCVGVGVGGGVAQKDFGPEFHELFAAPSHHFSTLARPQRCRGVPVIMEPFSLLISPRVTLVKSENRAC